MSFSWKNLQTWFTPGQRVRSARAQAKPSPILPRSASARLPNAFHIVDVFTSPIAGLRGTRRPMTVSTSERLGKNYARSSSSARREIVQGLQSFFANTLKANAKQFAFSEEELENMHQQSMAAESILNGLRLLTRQGETDSVGFDFLESAAESEYQYALAHYSRRHLKQSHAYWLDMAAKHGQKDAANRLLNIWTNKPASYSFLWRDLPQDKVDQKIRSLRVLVHGSIA